MTARFSPSSSQPVMKATAAPASAPATRNVAASGKTVNGPAGMRMPASVAISRPFTPELAPSQRTMVSRPSISRMSAPISVPATTFGTISRKRIRSSSSTCRKTSCPSRRQTATAAARDIPATTQKLQSSPRFGRPCGSGGGSLAGADTGRRLRGNASAGEAGAATLSAAAPRASAHLARPPGAGGAPDARRRRQALTFALSAAASMCATSCGSMASCSASEARNRCSAGWSGSIASRAAV